MRRGWYKVLGEDCAHYFERAPADEPRFLCTRMVAPSGTSPWETSADVGRVPLCATCRSALALLVGAVPARNAFERYRNGRAAKSVEFASEYAKEEARASSRSKTK